MARNGFGQIVAAWLLPNNKNEELEKVFKQVAKRFHDRGMGKLLYVYVDNCCNGDRALFERCFEVLRPTGIEARVEEALQSAHADSDVTLSKLGCDALLPSQPQRPWLLNIMCS
jgi:hypothetical protein